MPRSCGQRACRIATFAGANVAGADFTDADVNSARLGGMVNADRAKNLDKAKNLDRAYRN